MFCRHNEVPKRDLPIQYICNKLICGDRDKEKEINKEQKRTDREKKRQREN